MEVLFSLRKELTALFVETLSNMPHFQPNRKPVFIKPGLSKKPSKDLRDGMSIIHGILKWMSGTLLLIALAIVSYFTLFLAFKVVGELIEQINKVL